MIGVLFAIILWLIKAIFVVALCFIFVPIIIFLGAILLGMVFSMIGWIVDIFTWG
jgi:hypothetical protein